jgi:hypothetical protein
MPGDNLDQLKNKQTELDETIQAQDKLVSASLAIGVKMNMSKKELMDTGLYSEEDIDRALTEKSGTQEAGESVGPEPASIEPETEETRGEPSIEEGTNPLEMKVDETRKAYVKEYLKCKKKVRNQVAIDKIKTSFTNIGKRKENKKHINEEDYFTTKYKEAKASYDQARVDLGNDLFNKKKAELENLGVSGPELAQELKEYKATEILGRTIIDERQKLLDAKAEGSPVSPAAWKKLLHAYSKLPRYQKILLSTAVFATAASIGAGAVTGGVAGAAGWRFLRGMASGTVAAHVSKFLDKRNKKGNEKFQDEQNIKLNSITEQFGEGTITQEEFEKQADIIKAEIRKRTRNQTLAKAVVGIAVGAGVGALASYEFGSFGGAHNTIHPEAKTGASVGNINQQMHDSVGNKIDSLHNSQGVDSVDVAKPAVPDSVGVKNVVDSQNVAKVGVVGVDQAKVIPDNQVVTDDVIKIEVGKGHGAIQSIHELQDKLKSEYPDPSKAPASVQHILNTKADKLAVEYGMWKPGQVDEESALMKTGSSFSVDGEGNVTYHDSATNQDTLLEKGVDAKASTTYTGKMFDSDHSSRVSVSNHPTEDNLSGYRQTAEPIPMEVETGVQATDLKTSDALNEYLKANPPETIPTPVPTEATPGAGVVNTLDENTVVKPPVSTENATETLKTNAPTPKVIDNTPTPRSYYTGDTPPRTIYPTGAGGNIYTPPANDAMGDGFTTKVPMTRVPGAINTSNVTEAIDPNNVIHDVVQDPRHLESASEVRQVFGRSNVIIDKPDSDYINGVEAKEWNRDVDNWFKEKGVRFQSYDDYGKERELQELFPGKGIEKEIIYDKVLDKQVEHTNIDYFRDTKEWPIVKEIPAKYFFDFSDAKLADGSPIPKVYIDKLVETGVLKDTVGKAGDHIYTFANEKELERLSDVYAKVDPLNAKPIGNEDIEKYIGRIMRDAHKTNDDTIYILKAKASAIERSLDDGTFGQERAVPTNVVRQVNSNPYSRNSGIVYDQYNYRLTNNALGIIGNSLGYGNRWTH